MQAKNVDDQFASYDLSFLIAMSTLNAMENADRISSIFFRDSNTPGGVKRLSMYAGYAQILVTLEDHGVGHYLFQGNNDSI